MKKLIQSISLLLLFTAVLSAQPRWTPVIYTNSTTLYAKVTINGVPTQAGDKVAAFVGDECRGVADVVNSMDEGYITLLIQGENLEEEATFKVWRASKDVVYNDFNKVWMNPGGTVGTPPEFYKLDGKGPDWKPVIYTNSTTVYGEVTINNLPAQQGDIVGAFVNGECRGREKVIINNETAYITMLIQGEAAEVVTFQIWQNASDKELLVPRQLQSDPGGTIPLTNINAIDGLVAFYPFNSLLTDATENGFDISGSGLKFVQDRFNNQNSAIAFDGTTSQAEVSNSTSLDFPKNGFTISTWVKFKNNANSVIFGKHVNGYFNGYFLASANNQLQFYVSGVPLTSPELSNDDQWHLVTGVYDGTNATLYVDGVQKAAQQIDYTAFSPNPIRLGFMQTPDFPERYNGLIDDARIYNVPLSQTDVSNLFSENNWTAQEIYNLNPAGENWIKANSIYRIDWDASQYVDSVKIEFTPDDGNTWQTIAPSRPGHSESFYWKVPRISTTQAKIKISHLYSGVSVISSAPFIIALPEITVTSPNGGELWQKGSQQNISWNSSNLQQVKIDYSTNSGANWFPAANSIPASPNNFNWTVVNDTTRNALIRVSDADDSTFFDVSDAPFTIFQPKLSLTKPLGGERFRLGTTQNISWTSEFVNKVRVEFSQDNGSSWSVLPGADSVVASLSSFNWMSNVETKQAKIRVSDFKNSALQSTSNAFEIFVPKISLASPSGGEQWRVGTLQKIIWTSSDVAKVKIQYTTDNGTGWIILADSATASTGSIDWTIPYPVTTQAKVRITDYKDVTVSSQSAAPFTIYFPTVTLTSPTGGELWQIGSQKNITWTSSYLTKVKLEYTTDGNLWKLIADQVDATLNNYLWTIPNDPTVNARVRISDAVNDLVSFTIEGTFTIYQQKLTITAPLGSERYLIGTQKNVTWTSEYVNKVKIEFSQDNGSSWLVLPGADSVLASPSTFAWTPNVETKLAKIRISDSKNTSLQSVSNAFEIFKPKVTVTAPNGGEQWVVGTSQSIRWTSADVLNIKIDYSTNNGTSWTQVISSVPAGDGSYVWTIPNTPSTNCKVRISDISNSLFADMSDNVFSVILPKLTVVKPNGGEIFVVGKTDTIKWTSSNVTNVKLEYSINNGTNWNSILASTPASAGSYVWTIPNTPTANCLVRASDVANISLPDVSDNVFSIILPKISVLKPNGGEIFVVGKTDTIKWTSSNVVYVKLEYTTDNGTNWSSIITSTSATAGSFLWTIPNTPSINCKVRIFDITNSLFADMSDNVFSIILPKLTVVKPNGAESFVVGKTDTIKWSSSNVANVKLEYTTNNGTNWNSILTSTPASVGSYVWTIPNTPSTNCKVRISDVTNSSVTDLSDNVFSIINPQVVIDQPKQGERFRVGSKISIKWHSSNVDSVNIDLSMDNGATWQFLAKRIANDTSFYITGGNGQLLFRVSDAKNPSVFSITGPIEVYTPTVTVTSPNGEEQWKGGTEQTISWNQKDVTRLLIDYTLDDNSWISIPDTVDASVGSYKWMVPNTESSRARIRLTETIDTLVRDKSDAVFSIFIPKLTVVKPNGGETFVAGKTDTIKWTNSNVANVKLEFTSDNGLNWTSIITSTTASSGNFVWVIPNTPSKNCKIRISDVLNQEITDMSDEVFNIITPTISLLSPNGGEKWLMQTDHQISWTSSDMDSVRIDFSFDNGATWNVIAQKVFAWDGAFTWNVESTPTSQALVRVSQANDLSVQDVSNNVFTIYKEALAVISPNGGERLRAKTIVPITWNISEIINPKTRKKNLGEELAIASAPIQNLIIEYSSDDGTSWNTIINSVSANLKSYNWEVPVIESKNCFIRITDVDNETQSDTSDNVFEIYNPKVVVTSPNGGENWRATTTQRISWISNEINKVKIEYSTNDGFSWEIISDSIEAGQGSIEWTIPAERTTKARVRVTDITLASTSDTSDNAFAIVVPEITLTAPAGGENWKTNTVQQIKWNSLDVELVTVEYSTNSGTSWLPIKDSVLASSGVYNWTIPRSPTDQAKVRVSDVNFKEISSVSNIFTIIKPLILLTPQGGEKWFSGSVRQIKWNFNFVDSVKLEYSLNDGATWRTIANSLPATLLAYDWNIPQNTNSTQCRVKISDKQNYFTADSSLDVFTIIDPTLTVLAPNGGENLRGGTEFLITWMNQNSDSLIIDYSLNNGSTWTNISDSFDAKAEKLNWIVPKVTSELCMIRVIDKNYQTVGDTSDKVFSIYTPQITVITPTGGETWHVGQTKQIKWSSSFVEAVKIELTTNDGSSWRMFVNSYNAADSVFSLFIENTPSANCRIKISATEDSTVVDSSRSNFSITVLPPSIQVSIYQNPVLTQYCNVVLVTDSTLSALPITKVWRNRDTVSYQMNPIENSEFVYSCSIKFDTTAIYTVSSRIVSKMGIVKDTVRQFAIGVILPTLFAKVTSKDQGLSLSINPGVVEEKTFIMIEEEKVDKEIIYHLRPEKNFKKSMTVELSYVNGAYEEEYKLSVFIFENGEWKPIPSKVNKINKMVTASITTLGKVKLGIDVNKKEEIDLPKTFALLQNYPNPFNPSTQIAFHLPEDCDVTFEIYNMLGAKITTLRSGFALAGRYSVTWNGMNNANVQVPSGIYLYRLKTNKFDQVRKMILLK